MEGALVFLVPIVLDNRRMKREARLALLGPGLRAPADEPFDPGLEYLSPDPLPYLSSLSYSSLASFISEGERPPFTGDPACRAGLFTSMEDRRLFMLSRRGKIELEEFRWTEGGRDPDREVGVAGTGEARLPVV